LRSFGTLGSTHLAFQLDEKPSKRLFYSGHRQAQPASILSIGCQPLATSTKLSIPSTCRPFRLF
jgi:hypothetical protein